MLSNLDESITDEDRVSQATVLYDGVLDFACVCLCQCVSVCRVLKE